MGRWSICPDHDITAQASSYEFSQSKVHPRVFPLGSLNPVTVNIPCGTGMKFMCWPAKILVLASYSVIVRIEQYSLIHTCPWAKTGPSAVGVEKQYIPFSMVT